MKRFFLIGLALFSLHAISADRYDIDVSHSSVNFKVRHLGLSYVDGKFRDFSGFFNFDPKSLKDSRVEANIKTKSIDTNDPKREEHLKSDEFLAAEKYPNITFKSTKVSAQKKNEYKVDGFLTLRDVSKPVSLHVQMAGTVKDPWGNEKIAFTAKTKINRKDFGVRYDKVLDTGGLVVGDEVEIQLNIEGTKSKEEAVSKKAS